MEFIKEAADKKNIAKSGINEFLLENNRLQTEKILDFLKSSKPLLLVNGFLGAGKNAVVKHALSFCEAVTLEYNCFETTVLDDILLEFFNTFQKLSAQGIINPPKAKADNFAQKINAYFQMIEKPVVVILNSFEEILKDNKQEILDFIFHLVPSPKIKVVLISRVFNYEDFAKINYERVSVLALEKNIFEKYLRSAGIRQIGPLSDELYKYTHGYFFYVTLSLKIMQLKNISVPDFLSGYAKSFLSYNDFILREALALVDPVSGHLFRFLTVVRHPVPVNLLKTLQLYDEMRINFFTENLLLANFNNRIYLEGYYKDIAENTIPENVAVKLHRGCVELYETQLPLKPLERDLLISRQTMRREIEYHSMFIPKRPRIEAKPPNTAPPEVQDAVQEKEEQLKSMSFIFETEESDNALNTIAGSIQDYIQLSDEKAREKEVIKQLPLVELINRARQEEQNFNFKKAAMIYQRALTLENDDDYYTFLPVLLTKLADAYRQLSDWFNALKHYELAGEFYRSAGDTEKINEIKWEIAHIYYVTFKFEQAKTLLCEIFDSGAVSNDLKIKTCLLLASVNPQDSEKVMYYYEYALGIPCSDKKLLAEFFFKYALVLDEHNKPEQAVRFYKKCIDLDLSPKDNSFISSAYSNTAIIFEEAGKSDLALKCLHESLKIDRLTQNYNGIYISSMKLAEIHAGKSPEKTLEYYQEAKECAVKLNEPFYIASADIALGDFYYNRSDDENALKFYTSAYNTAKNGFSQDNIEKIEMRIKDIEAKRLQ
ncbi:MAG: hypothetical protein LBK53_07880 [Heliobacteriaceae bacterium]|jgi:tetratricopeptide (TPR) repeat protein|nr:hypothetical protein [Heliobacteriaceae bacterium]